MRIQHSTEIDAPVAEVWALTVDVEGLPSVTPTMTRVERLDDGPLAVGSEVKIKQPGQRERVWTVTELVPERRLAWSTRALGTTMTAAHDLAATAGGTSNTLSVEITGPLAPIVGALVRRPINSALATENAGFARAAGR